ncbi:LanC-like-like-like protein [Cladobotryum mycophilum]|uniref:LanC-like-like-like protein n=1 Tax=Cladobotryum mycophilum TaxID=491253 RepID=A0ABR0SS36_9HYPO
MPDRYIQNNLPQQSPGRAPLELMKSSLEHILHKHPPQAKHDRSAQGGLLKGFTSIAYLFFQLAALHPDVTVRGHHLLTWAQRYLNGDRGHLTLDGKCGISSEKLSYEALKACIGRKESDVQIFLENVTAVLGLDHFESELLQGRAGTLYLMRMIRHWVPESTFLLQGPIARISEKIIASKKSGDGHGWEWRGSEYFGAAHGDIGIITQLILTTPSLAPRLESHLDTLLNVQVDGNWPSSRRSLKRGDAGELVQWCHGAPGFVFSLRVLHAFFPNLQERIDTCIAKGQELIWKRGLLTKEPSLCHGILGNALALPRGPLREHFLGLATVEAIEKAKRLDREVFEPANYGQDKAVIFSYHTSAAWTWGVCEQETPPMIVYTDV